MPRHAETPPLAPVRARETGAAAERGSTETLPPLSLYAHLPWCLSKCPYCDFNSHALTAPLDERAYIRALIADLDADLAAGADCFQGRALCSVFIGGGTPNLFGAASIA